MKILLAFLSQLSAQDTPLNMPIAVEPIQMFSSNDLSEPTITADKFPFLYLKLASESSKEPSKSRKLPRKKDDKSGIPVVRSTQLKLHIEKNNVRTPEDQNSIFINGEPRHFLVQQKNKTQILGAFQEKDPDDYEGYYNSKSDDSDDSEADDRDSYIDYQREHTD